MGRKTKKSQVFNWRHMASSVWKVLWFLASFPYPYGCIRLPGANGRICIKFTGLHAGYWHAG